jgi:hypothetical protein
VVAGLEPDRQHLRAFAVYCADPQGAKPGPARFDPDGRLRCGRCALARRQQVLKRLLPAGAERGNVDDLAELRDVAVRQIEQRVDVGDAELVSATAGPHDVVAGPHVALGDDPEVEARTMLGDKEIRHFRFAQAHANPKARDTRLGDLEFGVTDAVAIADADLVVGEPGHGEVLAEVAGFQVVATQIRLPEVIRLGLVHHDSALLAAVAAEVALAVAVKVEAAHHDGSLDRGLPYPGVDGLAPPRHVLGHTDVHRYKLAHPSLLVVPTPQVAPAPKNGIDDPDYSVPARTVK